MRIDDLVGAVWIPGDGKANPADMTQALARGARAGGARLPEGVKVTGVNVANGRGHRGRDLGGPHRDRDPGQLRGHVGARARAA